MAKSSDAPVRPEWFTQSREHDPSAATSSQSSQQSQQDSDVGEDSHNDGVEGSSVAMVDCIARAVSGLRLTSKTRMSP